LNEDAYELKVDKWTFKVYKDRFYNENDCWTKIEGCIATVGITDFLQNAVSDIIFVECAKVGTKVSQFDEVASFESVKALLDVISPVSGTITETNSMIESQPELANKDPYFKAWFVKIKSENFDADKENLLGPEGYFEVLKRKVEEEKRKLEKKKSQD
jgi:glycine cleavage system H protein